GIIRHSQNELVPCPVGRVVNVKLSQVRRTSNSCPNPCVADVLRPGVARQPQPFTAKVARLKCLHQISEARWFSYLGLNESTGFSTMANGFVQPELELIGCCASPVPARRKPLPPLGHRHVGRDCPLEVKVERFGAADRI